MNSSSPPDSFIPVCPRCGQTLEAGITLEQHVCASVPVPASTGPIAAALAIDAPRVVSCPGCSQSLDVSAFDPMELVECVYCHKNFELLNPLGDYRLLKSYDAGWHQAVYLGERVLSGERVLIRVLSAHVLGQPDATERFFQEAETIRAQCDPALLSDCILGEYSGFHYLLLIMQPGASEEAVMRIAGVEVNDAPVVKIDEIMIPALPRKTAPCENCGENIPLSHHDPLDEFICPKCNQSFEILRDFHHYRIDYRLNAGGTSILYLAKDTRSQQKLALKVLSASEINSHPESAAAMLKEVELTRNLIHPNVIQVYDGGEFNGFYYMALELVQGLALGEILEIIQEAAEQAQAKQKKTPASSVPAGQERFKQGLPELVCLEIMLQAAAGLGVAHSNGLIHGDVKPQNIMITFEGIVKVLDFGLVQFANAEKLLGTEGEQTVFGTPLYIPPERVRGEPEDFSSDYYSLGATLYHLLRGIEPFRAKTGAELAVMHTNYPLISFKAFAPWVSETTCRVVEKSMKKTLDGRYKSHIEFIADITLAKSLLLQQMKAKSNDGRAILKEFMKSMPALQSKSGLWKKARTSMISTYKYATRAITARFQALARRANNPEKSS